MVIGIYEALTYFKLCKQLSPKTSIIIIMHGFLSLSVALFSHTCLPSLVPLSCQPQAHEPPPCCIQIIISYAFGRHRALRLSFIGSPSGQERARMSLLFLGVDPSPLWWAALGGPWPPFPLFPILDLRPRIYIIGERDKVRLGFEI